MCGIAGYLSPHRLDDDILVKMVESLHHRGPNADGYLRDGPLQAGMRRLSINDLAGGNQPLSDATGRIRLLYNGEIYNYPALRAELEAKGHVFRSRSDGEVICHLWHEHGLDLFERLDGMFAAALWLADSRTLILARDIPGEKPLHYARLRSGGLAFGSEIRSLEVLMRDELTLDRQALWDYPTFLWVPEPATVWQQVRALPRSHILIAREGMEPELRPYANRFGGRDLNGASEREVIDETRRVVEEAVVSRLLSDVPVGSFLSGGLDSSIVATLAAGRLNSLDTFSVGFQDLSDPYHGRADESADAARTAARIGSRHHAIHVTAKDFRDLLEPFVIHGDQPFAVSSGLGILAVSRAARDAGIKVLLSGDGADECFGGYSWYRHLDLAATPAVPAAPGDITSFQNFGMPLADRLNRLAAMAPPQRAWAWHYYAHETEKSALFAPSFAEGLAPSFRHFTAFDPSPHWRPETYVAQDRDFYFPQEMLRKVDRMTMAFSVEGRAPFAAPSVLAHAGKLTYDHMVRGDTLKFVLRRAFADILDDEVVNRPKHGFNVPIDHWLKQEWADLVDDAFSPTSALGREGMLAPDAAATAQKMLHSPTRLNGHSILCFVLLNLWLSRRA